MCLSYWRIETQFFFQASFTIGWRRTTDSCTCARPLIGTECMKTSRLCFRIWNGHVKKEYSLEWIRGIVCELHLHLYSRDELRRLKYIRKFTESIQLSKVPLSSGLADELLEYRLGLWTSSFRYPP